MDFITQQNCPEFITGVNSNGGRHKIWRLYIVHIKQSEAADYNLIFFFLILFYFSLILKFCTYVSIQKLTERQLSENHTLICQAGAPRLAAVRWLLWGGRATHNTESVIYLHACSVFALCSGCQHRWQWLPAGCFWPRDALALCQLRTGHLLHPEVPLSSALVLLCSVRGCGPVLFLSKWRPLEAAVPSVLNCLFPWSSTLAPMEGTTVPSSCTLDSWKLRKLRVQEQTGACMWLVFFLDDFSKNSGSPTSTCRYWWSVTQTQNLGSENFEPF